MAIDRIMPHPDQPPILQIQGNHTPIRPARVSTQRDILHEIERAPRRLGNPRIESPRWVRDRVVVGLELVVDQPEAVRAVPQRKGLGAERAADAGDGRLFGAVAAVVEFAACVGGCVAGAALGFAPALFLASAD